MSSTNSKRNRMVYVSRGSTRTRKICAFDVCFSSQSKFLFFDCFHSPIDYLQNVFARDRLVFSSHQKVIQQHESLRGLVIRFYNPKGSNLLYNAAKSLKASDTSGIARAKYFDFHPLPSQRLQMGVLWASDHIAVMNRNWVLSDTWSKYTLIMTENDHGVVGVNSVQNGPCHT